MHKRPLIASSSLERFKAPLLFGATVWFIATMFILMRINQIRFQDAVQHQASNLESWVKTQVYSNEELLDKLRRWKWTLDESRRTRDHIAVLVLAYNRVSVRRTLRQVARYLRKEERFKVILSQDGFHEETAEELQRFSTYHGFSFIQQPDQTRLTAGRAIFNIEGYHRISRHYKWALSMVFERFNHTAVIIIEDDLDIAPDFFEYFAATLQVLKQDPSLFCVSAYNDNGKPYHVSESPDVLHRTEFFSGLGWLLTRDVWQEWHRSWPKAFWDDWVRAPAQRRGRACIRPEISRSRTFGREGVSRGQFFDRYLKDVRLNNAFVSFSLLDLSYLIQERYDPAFELTVYETPAITMEDLTSMTVTRSRARVTYHNDAEFNSIADELDIMPDMKAGVPRTGYKGVVSTIYKGVRIYVAPPRQGRSGNSTEKGKDRLP